MTAGCGSTQDGTGRHARLRRSIKHHNLSIQQYLHHLLHSLFPTIVSNVLAELEPPLGVC